MTGDQMSNEMAPYEERAWGDIVEWREHRLTARTRRVLPAAVRDRAVKAGETAKDKFEALPGAQAFEAKFLEALNGLGDLGARTAMASVRDNAIIEAYRKRGHTVDDLDDIRKLDLQVIDRVKPKLGLAYASGATAEGAVAGLAVSGGQLLATAGGVFGVGAGGAPGAATVIGAMAGDAVAVLLGANRAVAHIAAYYGYDVDKPDERLFALAVLGMGTATGAGKVAAYAEINKLVQMLARRATWEQLRKNAVTRVVEQVFARIGIRITQRKLGQAVPIVGAVFGAGMNAKLFTSVTDDAEHIYRERFLRERYGLPAFDTLAASGGGREKADVIDVAELLGEELDRADDGDRSTEDVET
ncbi:EcsC family protein [Blastococcus sp. SYSU DS0510]